MKYVYGSIVFALGIALGVSAQDGFGTAAHAQTKPLPDVTTSLWNAADTLGAIALAFGMDDALYVSEQAKSAALALSSDDIESLMGARVAMAKLGVATQNLADTLEADLGDPNIVPDAGTKSAGLPSAPYSDICGSSRLSTGALIASLEVFLAAEIVREEALRGCQQTAVAAGVGGNASTACIATDVIFFAAKAVYENLVLCEGDIDSAEIKGTYDRAAHIHDDIGGLDTKLDEIIELVKANGEAIERNRLAICDTKRLVTTPQGLRESDCATCSDQPGFPYAWPEGQGGGPGNSPHAAPGRPTRSRGILGQLFPRWF
jgi:hypothetical protein